MSRRIGFLTCQDLASYFPSEKEPLLTHDDQLAAEGLRQLGLEVVAVVWGQSYEELKAQNLALLIVRSPWDYFERRHAFAQWLAGLSQLALPVENPVPLLLWNLDKSYLQDLADCGVATVETHYLAPDKAFDPYHWLERWGGFVIKPCISAAAYQTFRVRSHQEVACLITGNWQQQEGEGLLSTHISTSTRQGLEQPFAALRQGRSFLIQPYLAQVEELGEWSLIFLNGHYSHAVLKRPKAGGWLVQDELGGSVSCLPAPEEAIAVATQAFAQIWPAFHRRHPQHPLNLPHPLLYARIDVLASEEGMKVGEIELVEPELFFLDRRQQERTALQSAVERFCQGVVARL